MINYCLVFVWLATVREAAAEVKGTLTCDERAGNTGGITFINQDDIKSDEIQLQTEL